MDDFQLDKLLRDWAEDRLPDDAKRNEIVQNVFKPSRSPKKTVWLALLTGAAVLAASILLVLTLRHESPITKPGVEDDSVRVSLLVLRRVPGSDSDVEFLEDAVIVAKYQDLREIEIGDHRLFLWVYPLEKSLFTLDVGVDKAAESGIVAVPDQTRAVQLKSNGDRFDVFVSVLPNT